MAEVREAERADYGVAGVYQQVPAGGGEAEQEDGFGAEARAVDCAVRAGGDDVEPALGRAGDHVAAGGREGGDGGEVFGVGFFGSGVDFVWSALGEVGEGVLECFFRVREVCQHGAVFVEGCYAAEVVLWVQFRDVYRRAQVADAHSTAILQVPEDDFPVDRAG